MARFFNKSTDGVNFGNASAYADSFLATNGGTVFAVIYLLDAGESNVGYIVGKNVAGGTNGWNICLTGLATSRVKLQLQSVNTGTDGNWTTTSTDLQYQKWQSIGVNYNASSTSNDPTFFIDGLKKAMTRVAAPANVEVSESTSNLWVGSRSDGAQVWGGFIYRVAMWKNYMLSEDEHFRLAKGVNPQLIRGDKLVFFADFSNTNIVDLIQMKVPTLTGTSPAPDPVVIDYTQQKTKSLLSKFLVLIDGFTSVSRTWNLRHDISSYISRNWNLRHDISVYVNRVWNLRHDISSYISRTWNLRSDISSYVTNNWNIRHDISSYISRNWNIRHDILNYVSRTWNLRNDISQYVSRNWNLRHDVSMYTSRIWNLRHDILANIVTNLEFFKATLIRTKNQTYISRTKIKTKTMRQKLQRGSIRRSLKLFTLRVSGRLKIG